MMGQGQAEHKGNGAQRDKPAPLMPAPFGRQRKESGIEKRIERIDLCDQRLRPQLLRYKQGKRGGQSGGMMESNRRMAT